MLVWLLLLILWIVSQPLFARARVRLTNGHRGGVGTLGDGAEV
jgi:hypothetical protein